MKEFLVCINKEVRETRTELKRAEGSTKNETEGEVFEGMKKFVSGDGNGRMSSLDIRQWQITDASKLWKNGNKWGGDG